MHTHPQPALNVNVILAWFAVPLQCNHHNYSDDNAHVVGRVEPGSLSASAGVNPGDVVIAVNGIMVQGKSTEFMLDQITGSQTVRMVIDRVPDGERNIPLSQLCPVPALEQEPAQVQLSVSRANEDQEWGLGV